MVVSAVGVVGRFAGDLMMSALGWASSLLFGRVPRSHERFLVAMLGGSFLWLLVILGLLLPSVASWALSTTPHPPFVDQAGLAIALLTAAFLLPALVGLAGARVPMEAERPRGLSIVREVFRGYVLTPLISVLVLFLAGVGVARKVRSLRNGWSDTHIPIVMTPGGYDRTASDLQDALRSAGIAVLSAEAPRVLTFPAWLLTRVAGPGVRRLRPDRLIELCGQNLRVGVYPSDIAISCPNAGRLRVRAVLRDAMLTSEAHLTTSAEAQQIEDRLQRLSTGGSGASSASVGGVRAALIPIDADMLGLELTTDEWDTLSHLRLQVECVLLRAVADAEAGAPVVVGRVQRPSISVSADPAHGGPSVGEIRMLHGEAAR